jgi:hypothetical protein
MLYDPARIRKSDIDNVSPVARIPVKNSMYNKDIASAVHVVPYRDDGVSDIMGFAERVISMGEIAIGQNRVQQGQFQKGNKTRKEFDTVMGNANSRQQLSAVALEYSFFAPIKEIILSNILQYQPPTTLVNTMTKKEVEIDPAVLRNARMKFAVSDGLLPTDKLVGTEMFVNILQTAQLVPEIRAKIDIMGMLFYWWKLQGAHWLKDFERTPEQQAEYMQLMAQASQAAGTANPPPAAAQTSQGE